MVAFTATNRVTQVEETEVGFIPLGDGVESHAVTVETRKEVCPSQVDPRLFDGEVVVRVYGDRSNRSVRGDVVGYVKLAARSVGNRLFIVASMFDLRLAHREEKSPGMSDELERELEAAAIRNPGGAVVPLVD